MFRKKLTEKTEDRYSSESGYEKVVAICRMNQTDVGCDAIFISTVKNTDPIRFLLGWGDHAVVPSLGLRA